MKLTKAQKKKEVARDLLSVFVEAQDLWMASKRDASRIKFLRPSALPFCPVGFFCGHATLGMASTMDFMGEYYTRVGTAVHDVMQKFMSPSQRFLADWECLSCGKRRRMSHKNECCEHTMKYHELLIDYKGIVGHIDGVFRDRRGRYWILDYKTSSLKGAPYKLKSPGAAYKEQVETYATLLYLQYKIKVEGVMLMFLPRDNPKEPQVWVDLIDRPDMKAVWKRLKAYKKMHAEALAVETAKEAIALARYGRCKNEWCQTCKRPDELEAQLRSAHKRGVKKGHVPLTGLK